MPRPFEERRQVGPGRVDDRRQAEERAHNERHPGHEREDPPVEGQVQGDPLGIPGAQQPERFDAGHQDQKTDGSTQERDQQAFHQELPDDDPRPGSQGDEHGPVLLTGHGPGEHQVGDVEAGREQQDPGHDQQEETGTHESASLGRKDLGLGQWKERHGLAAVAVRMALGELCGDRPHLAGGLLQGDSRRQAAEQEQRAAAPRLEQAGRAGDRLGGRERHPDLRAGEGVRTVIALGRHAHHLERPPVDPEGPAHGPRIAGEAFLPEIVAHHDHVPGNAVLLGEEEAAEGGPEPESFEVAR